MSSRMSHHEWDNMLPLLLAHPRVYVGSHSSCRLFLDAVKWIARTGAQWRELPPTFGRWNSVYKRFARWSELGIFEDLLETFAKDADFEWVCFDSTINRAHMCAAGAPKKKGLKNWEEAKEASQPSFM